MLELQKFNCCKVIDEIILIMNENFRREIMQYS